MAEEFHRLVSLQLSLINIPVILSLSIYVTMKYPSVPRIALTISFLHNVPTTNLSFFIGRNFSCKKWLPRKPSSWCLLWFISITTAGQINNHVSILCGFPRILYLNTSTVTWWRLVVGKKTLCWLSIKQPKKDQDRVSLELKDCCLWCHEERYTCIPIAICRTHLHKHESSPSQLIER